MEYSTVESLRERKVLTAQIETLCGQVVLLNLEGDAEDHRHFGVVLEDSVNAGEIKSGFFLWVKTEGLPVLDTREYEERFLAWRRSHYKQCM